MKTAAPAAAGVVGEHVARPGHVLDTLGQLATPFIASVITGAGFGAALTLSAVAPAFSAPDIIILGVGLLSQPWSSAPSRTKLEAAAPLLFGRFRR